MATGSNAGNRVNRVGAGDDPAQKPFGLIDVSFNKLVLFSAVGGAIEFASTPLCGLPLGDFIVFGGVLHLDVTEDPLTANIVNTYTVSTALGTTATADLTLSGTEINLMNTFIASAAVSSVTPHITRNLDGINTVAGALAAAAGTFRNPTGALAVFLNMTLPDADISGNPTPASLRVKGRLKLAYSAFGKNT